jgi:hypothetical protein
MKTMVTVKLTDDSYKRLVRMMAQTLEAEMIRGKVVDWDESNCETLQTLIELNMANVG